MNLLDQFEASRPRLVSLASRVLGSRHDAEDVVQTAWTRVSEADLSEVHNVPGYLTTVTTRLCLDLLRGRDRRPRPVAETPDRPSDVDAGVDEAYLRQEDVSRAVAVLLDELTPRQRVAYVLHDLFDVPFAQVASTLGVNEAAAKKLASRARNTLRAAEPPEAAPDVRHWRIVEAFLAAARGGDLGRLVSLMSPDAVRVVDPRLLSPGSPEVVTGASAIARETGSNRQRLAAAAPCWVDGRPGAVVAPGGRGHALVSFDFAGGRISAVSVIPYSRGRISRDG